jgi:hypothetical protein
MVSGNIIIKRGQEGVARFLSSMSPFSSAASHEQHKRINVDVTLTGDSRQQGYYTVYENVTVSRREYYEVNVVSISKRRSDRGELFPVRTVTSVPTPQADGKMAPPTTDAMIDFYVDVSPDTLAADRGRAIRVGLLREAHNSETEVNAAQVVFRIIAHVKQPLPSDCNIILRLDYSVSKRPK